MRSGHGRGWRNLASRARHLAGVQGVGREAPGGPCIELADLAPHALARVAELALELLELGASVPYELQLAVEMTERLRQQRAAAAPMRSRTTRRVRSGSAWRAQRAEAVTAAMV